MMKRVDAKEEEWTPMEIKGVDGYFSDMRIEPDSVPEGFHVWELRDDSDGWICQYKPHILVNFYGTFITKGELPLDDEDSGYIENPDEWGYTNDPISFDEILKL